MTYEIEFKVTGLDEQSYSSVIELLKTIKKAEIVSSQNDGKPIVNCSSCHALNSIRNNKVEIDIGDDQGSVASVQFEYCEKCGWRGDVEWFD